MSQKHHPRYKSVAKYFCYVAVALWYTIKAKNTFACILFHSNLAELMAMSEKGDLQFIVIISFSTEHQLQTHAKSLSPES